MPPRSPSPPQAQAAKPPPRTTTAGLVAPAAAGGLPAVAQRSRLIQLIQQLPASQQNVLSLLYEHALSLRAVAQALGIPSSAVVTLHASSMARLRDLLGCQAPVAPPPVQGFGFSRTSP